MKRLPLTAAAGALLLTVSLSSAQAGSVAYNALVNSKTPLVFLGLDETSGSVANDLSGNGRNGAFGPEVTLGQTSAGPGLNSAVLFDGTVADGTAAGVTVPNSAAFDAIGTGDFTVELWFNTSNIGGREDLFTFKGGSSDFGIHLGSQTADQFRVYHNGFVISSGTAIAANTWYNLAVVRSGTDVNLYLDGTSIGSGTDSNSLNTGGASLLLGSNTGALYYSGLLDEVAFYNTALTATDLQGHVAAAAVPEPSAVVSLVGGASLLLGLVRRRRSQS